MSEPLSAPSARRPWESVVLGPKKSADPVENGIAAAMLSAMAVVFAAALLMQSMTPFRATLPLSQLFLVALLFRRQKRDGGQIRRQTYVIYAVWLGVVVLMSFAAAMETFHHG